MVPEGQHLRDKLETRHRDLKLERNRTHSLVNQRMPTEILSTVFAYCIPSPRELEYFFEHQRPVMLTPLQLGRICHHWRDVAWSTPALWNQIFVFLKSEQLGETASLLADLACEWLDRSGALPLSFYIQMDDNDFYDTTQSLGQGHPVLEIVEQDSQRWQDL